MKNLISKSSILLCITLFLVALSVCAAVKAVPTADVNNAQAISCKAGSEDIIRQACKSIRSGDFEYASKIVSACPDVSSPEVAKLKDIFSKYNDIQTHRKKDKLEAYDKEVKELNKLRAAADANGLDDINDVTAVLATAIKLRDYADENDKDKILIDELVQKAVQKALEKSAEYEDKGNWLDALMRCYGFIVALDEDNKLWKEHQDKLTDKALIKASLTDNPCEASAERHKGIKKEMFVRAIMVLDYNYVIAVNYTEMAVKALKQCELLAVVLGKMEPTELLKFNNGADAINGWTAGIGQLAEQVQSPVIGITRDRFLSIFEEVIKLNKKTLALNDEILIAQFSEAALNSLDPHTTLVWPWYIKDFQKSMKSEFSGVGIEISKADGPLQVNSLLPDTPAYNSGIDAGDIIEAVDGELTKDMTIQCAVRKITGPEGTPVVLTVRHPEEDKSRDITIVRAKIKVRTIKSWQRTDNGKWKDIVDVQDKIGYIRITSFTSEQTSNELETQLKKLEKESMRGLILDLRFNSGGYLNQAVEIVDKFIKEGKLIVSTRPRLGSFPTWEISTKSVHPEYPLVILINGQSASASEIVAGALQDESSKRAVLVGSRSYGKGSVQTIVGYPGNGAQLKYTMAYYYLPSGQRVKNRYERKKLDKKDWGVAPDVEVKLHGNEIRKLYDIQRDNSVLVSKDHKQEKQVERHSLEESIEADPQLGVAILVVKAMLVESEVDNKIATAKVQNN